MAEDLPAPIAATIEAHCVRCHDSDNTLDLTVLPAASASEVWMKILEKVESSKMPPPRRDGTVAERFPLDPAERARFLSAVSSLLGPLVDRPVPPAPIPQDIWRSLGSNLASGVVPPEVVRKILGPSLPSGGLMTPQYQRAITNTSLALCRALATADLGRPPQKRMLLGQTPAEARFDPRRGSALARVLLRRTFGTDAEPETLREEVTLMAVVGKTAPWPEPWIAACVALLSGPATMFLARRP
jgi:hypothetical protein